MRLSRVWSGLEKNLDVDDQLLGTKNDDQSFPHERKHELAGATRPGSKLTMTINDSGEDRAINILRDGLRFCKSGLRISRVPNAPNQSWM